jgi:hypothetical protein
MTKSGNGSRFVSEPGRLRLASWGILLCLIVGTVAISLAVLNNPGFPLDDSWIHQVIGRNVARFGIPGFVAGAATSGSTSTLWPWIIAANYRLAPWASPSAYLLTVNIVCLVPIIAVLYHAAARDRLEPLDRLLLVGLPAITGNFVWLLSTGMEHLLFIAATFLAAHIWNDPQQQPKRAVLAGLCCGIAIVTRPEAVVFVPVFLLYGWRMGRSRQDLAGFVLPCVLFTGLVVLSNWWTAHSLIPSTLSGRRWLFFTQPDAPTHTHLLPFMIGWADHVARYFFGIGGSVKTVLLVAAALVAVALLGVVRLVRNRAHRITFLLLLTGANLATYAVLLPTAGQGMRYQAMVLIFIFPLIALGGLQLLARARWIGNAVVTVAVFAVAFVNLYSWSGITKAGIQHINSTHVRMGKWLAANLPHDTPVASLDIGGVGYFGTAHVVDIGGLTDPAFVPYLYSSKVPEYLRMHDIRLVILPEQGDEDCAGFTRRLQLCNGPELTKRRVVAFSTPFEIWNVGVGATWHALQRQTLYEITWK